MANITRRYSTLSGPDTTGDELMSQPAASNSFTVNSELSGRDGNVRSTLQGVTASGGQVTASVRQNANGVIPVNTGTPRNTGGSPPVPVIERGTSDPYYFNGSISEDVLHRYLDKALVMDVSVSGGSLAEDPPESGH